MPNKIFALSVLGPAVMVPGCGWGREQLGCNPTLPGQRKRKKAWHEHFGSSLFQREQNFVYCLLSFDFFHGCGSGLGFQIPVPAKQQARFCPQIPASNPLELQWFWSTHKLLPVYLITEGAVVVRAWTVICCSALTIKLSITFFFLKPSNFKLHEYIKLVGYF